jgi:Membrane-associated sensor, integral membrane domain
MTTRSIWDASKVSLATITPTALQRRLTLTVVATVLVVTAIMAPLGATQLPQTSGFIPATEAVTVICDLLTAALLVSHAKIIGSRGLLLLAGGYLFSALTAIAHVLTFPGAFAPSGLLGAGLQTTAWLFVFWHFGLPAAVIGYTCQQRETRAVTASIISWGAIFVIGLVCFLTWIAVVRGDALPALFVDRRGFTPMANYVTGVDLLISVLALVLMLRRQRKSVLDLWLTVTLVTLVAEVGVTTFVIMSRFSLGFYTSRLLSLIASAVVMIAFLAETTRQGMRLARANLALQLERGRKLTTLDAALGAIAHEVRQPIASIAYNADP